jgi:hypothetical protein
MAKACLGTTQKSFWPNVAAAGKLDALDGRSHYKDRTQLSHTETPADRIRSSHSDGSGGAEIEAAIRTGLDAAIKLSVASRLYAEAMCA